MSLNKSSKILISIEGNIGVGKSTFIELLKNKWANTGFGPCEIVLEPVDMWIGLKNSDGKNILQTFYEDVPRWSYSFQNVACISRMMKIEETIRTTDSKYIFLDRSLGTDKNVFEAMLHDEGNINELEHSMYNLWCNFYHKYVNSLDEQIHIYLKASPTKCYERIVKRGRVEEKNITLDYLQNLNKYHDKWLLSDSMKSKTIVIDSESEFESDLNIQNEMINQIVEFLKKYDYSNKIDEITKKFEVMNMHDENDDENDEKEKEQEHSENDKQNQTDDENNENDNKQENNDKQNQTEEEIDYYARAGVCNIS